MGTQPGPERQLPKPDEADRASQAAPATLEHARRFLREDEVRHASAEKKTEFLKAKGLSEADIRGLLSEANEDPGVASGHTTDPISPSSTAPRSPAAESQAEDKREHLQDRDHPPIVTYPEFLAKPTRPPPLITASGFLATVYGFAGLSTLVYGVSQYVVAPMASSLADARVELHEAASSGLSRLVGKLESTVSEIPPTISGGATGTGTAAARGLLNDGDDAASSSCGDPTEVFHRDVGVQTTPPPPSPPAAGFEQVPGVDSRPSVPGSSIERQTARITGLTRSLQTIRQGLVSESEDLEDIKTVVDIFKDDLYHLTYPPSTGFVAAYSPYGAASRNEPDDEVKKVKDNIRRVKGVLLSARSFPAASGWTRSD